MRGTPGDGVPDDVAQLRIGEGLVADEVHAFDFGGAALNDLEDKINAILLELDDLGIDGRRVAALPTVDVENALHVGLHAGADGERLFARAVVFKARGGRVAFDDEGFFRKIGSGFFRRSSRGRGAVGVS